METAPLQVGWCLALYSDHQIQISFIIEHCTFDNNITEYGSGVNVYIYTNTCIPLSASTYQTTVPKSSFLTHYFLETSEVSVVVHSTFQLAGVQTSH